MSEDVVTETIDADDKGSLYAEIANAPRNIWVELWSEKSMVEHRLCSKARR